MSAQLTFHRLAEAELNDAARYYENESKGLGLRFLDAVQQVADAILEFPQGAPVVRGSVRRRLVPGFPYGLLYSVKPDQVRVLAVMNLRRRPFYWLGRS